MNRRSGFTLVEVAIVLVIIGLLIGGILAARSLLTSSEIQAVTSQIGQFDIAIENFKTKFNCLPGDCNKFSPAGDNDDKIEDASGTDGLGAEFTGEVANFWVQLEQGEGIKVTANVGTSSSQMANAAQLDAIEPAAGARFTATVSGPLKNFGEVLNVPSVKIGDKHTGVIVTYDYLDASNTASLRARGIAGAYIIGGVQSISNSTLSIAPSNIEDSIAPQDALALDKKLDDGNPLLGSLIANSKSGNCYSGSEYNVSVDSSSCSLVAGYLRLTQARSVVATQGSSSGGGCSDPGTGGSCDAWNSSICSYDAPNTSCGSGQTYDYSSCSCISTSCSNTCQYGSPTAYPDCSCADNGNCANSSGTWNSVNGTCDCATAGAEYYWGGYACLYDPTGCRGDQQCLCRTDGWPWYWDGSSCQNDVTSCYGDAQCQCNYYVAHYGPYFYWDGSSCQYDATGCYGDAQCQCSADGSPWYWDGSSCQYDNQYDDTGCHQDAYCQCNYYVAHYGPYFYWDGSSCLEDDTGCNGDVECQCSHQGWGYYWDGSSCQYDTTGCNGDASCHSYEACASAGPYFYWDGSSCLQDATGCNGDASCQGVYCNYYAGGSWDGSNCNY